jgi:hypothetical protein
LDALLIAMIDPITATSRWIETVVIGLNLCPFAKRIFDANRIRYTVSEARETETLREDLTGELLTLIGTPRTEVETAILIHPHVLTDFFDYNDFLAEADDLLDELDLTGVVQIASFHPQYRFAGTEADDVTNYTNRSPYPMLHLLREESVTEVAGNPEMLDDIPERNIATMRRLGLRGLHEWLSGKRGDGVPLPEPTRGDAVPPLSEGN